MPSISSVAASGDQLSEERSGNAQDPCLGAPSAAAFVECSKNTIYRWERRGKLGQGPFLGGYRLSNLKMMKTQREQDRGDRTYLDERGTWITLKKAALLMGIPYRTLLRMLNNSHPNARHGFLQELGVAAEKKLPAHGGPEEWCILESDAIRAGKTIKLALKRKSPKGFEHTTEIVTRLCLTTIGERIELWECLQCWREQNRLAAVQMLRKEPGKARSKKGEIVVVERLYRRWFFDAKRAIALWNNECSVPAGAALIRQLLAPGCRLSAKEIKEQMRQAGFVGRRLDKACNEAGLARYASNGAGSSWVYELPTGKPRKSAKEVLQTIMAGGPVRVEEGERQVRKAGWSPYSAAIKKAKDDLKIKSLCPEQGEDKKRLRHGPYSPPSCRSGDQLVCAIAGPVTVAGIHAAPVPWPYMRRSGTRRRLILYGDLVRAVRCEVIRAVAHSWGVAHVTVCGWRRALGIVTDWSQQFYWCLPGQKLPDAVANGEQAGVGSKAGQEFAKYPGHTKKSYRTGRKHDPKREPALEFCYDEYFVRCRPWKDIYEETRTKFSERYRPGALEDVREFAIQWASRFEPPLPIDRKTACERFGKAINGHFEALG